MGVASVVAMVSSASLTQLQRLSSMSCSPCSSSRAEASSSLLAPAQSNIMTIVSRIEVAVLLRVLVESLHKR